jgi:uncharacterized membrane protein
VTGRSGNANGDDEAFLYSGGAMIGIGGAQGFSINTSGEVTGYLYRPDPNDSNALISHAFLYSSGVLHDLDPDHPDRSSAGVSINDKGDIAGGLGSRSVIFTHQGEIHTVPHGSYKLGLSLYGINDLDQIAAQGSGSTGLKAVVITGNTVRTLQGIYPYYSSSGTAINYGGVVCGWSQPRENSSDTHATLWPSSSPIDLGALPGDHESYCLGMDDFGREVGTSQRSDLATQKGVMFTTLGIQRLDDLISPSLGIKITDADGISNTGFIGASCYFPGKVLHACLLTPNPVLILKKEIFALTQGDPECIQCRTVLKPEANSLPESLEDLGPRELADVAASVRTIGTELRRLRLAEIITAPQARLLLHDAVLTLRAAESKTERSSDDFSEWDDPASAQL